MKLTAVSSAESLLSSFVTRKLKIHPNGQIARLGDGCMTIASVGEIDVAFTRDKWSVRFQAIVVEKLNTDSYELFN